jgi:DNA gyrase subunit A
MSEKNIGTIIDADINEKMEKAYLDYSMSVIISRALPDVRDGLKPVHRRVLTAMSDLNLQPNKPYRKSAKITGDTTGNYHPHGTASVYDTLVRLAQDFSLRYPLVDGQGNFGSVDGDSAAAERYTEARMTKLAMDILRDLDKETVDYVPNYDGSRMMPSVMPSVIPNLLVNGADGIAVGMATKIPPHNLTEICNGLIAMLDNPDIDADGLMEYIEGPDFPTGGIIKGRRGIVDYINTGRGRVVVRGRTEIEEDEKGRSRIIISELPYQVNKANLVEKIANLVRSGQLEGISDLRDESDRKGMHVVVVLKKDAYPQVVLNKLFTHTQLQQTFGVINLALVNNRPKVMTLKETMQEYLKFREEVVVRRTKYDLRKAEERAHILEGYRIALDNIDEIVELIKTSKSPDAAKTGLIERFSLSEIQAQAILDLRLARLTGLERQKIEDEYRALIEKIAGLKEILANRELQLAIIREEIEDVRARFGDERRTSIEFAEDDMNIEDLIADEDVVITISHSGYAKRLTTDTYRTQGRGGKGIAAMGTKEEDWVEQLFVTTTHQFLLVLTEKGQLYWLKAYHVPEAGRTSKGRPLVNMIDIAQDDKVHAVVPVRGFDENQFLVMCTDKGIVKRTPLTDFSRPRRAGIRAINLLEDERLVEVKVTDGDREIVLATSAGMAIRFHETDMRPMGRTARGVKGVTLNPDTEVVGMVVIGEEDTLLVITENGYGKRTKVDDYRIQKRGGRGLITIKASDRNGKLIGIKAVKEDQELMVITRNGIMIRMALSDISTLGRNTQGVRIISLKGNDSVVGVARLEANEDDVDNNEDGPDNEGPDNTAPSEA